MLTRRTMLASVAATGLAVLAACTGRSPARSGDVPEPGTDGPALTAGERREVVLAADEFGMLNFPDGHLTYLATDAGYRMWLSSGLPGGGGRTVALDTADLVALRPADESGSDAVAGLVPPGGTVAFDSDYSAPGSVFPSADGSALWLIYHGENHTFAGVTNDGSPFYATIGLASSTDGGRSWTRRGAVVTGQVPRDDQPAPRDVVGAGSPCALVADDGYVYLLYIDWNLATPDELHLARAPLAAVDEPAAWQKWHQGSFSTPGAGGASTAVVTRPGDGDVTVVAGGPSLSWNTYLGRYVLVFQSADGFWWTHSTTLTDWAEPVRFLDLDAPVVRGAAFVAYGSLLSPGEASDRVTGQDGFLYLAIAEDQDDSHGLCRIATRFTGA